MIGQPRPAGRHRAGRPYTLVHRRLWDGPARAEAERLERSRPGWVVLYGVGSRRYFAMAAWPVPEPIMVSAPTADALDDRMGEAETALLLQFTAPPAPAPAVTPPPRRERRRPRPSSPHRRVTAPAHGLPYPP